MEPYEKKVESFLACKIIAVVGVSRKPESETGNIIYKKFRSSNYKVFPINPNAEIIEGDKAYKDLYSVPEKVEAVMISTNPKISETIVKQCLDLEIKNIWFHKTMGNGSYNKTAVELCKSKSINVIEEGCPMLHIAPVDFAHKCLHFGLKVFGKLKK